MQSAAKATRSGEPAYIAAPPRLTQTMANLQRDLNSRSTFRQLQADAADAGELGLILGAAMACFLTCAFLAVIAGIAVLAQGGVA